MYCSCNGHAWIHNEAFLDCFFSGTLLSTTQASGASAIGRSCGGCMFDPIGL